MEKTVGMAVNFLLCAFPKQQLFSCFYNGDVHECIIKLHSDFIFWRKDAERLGMILPLDLTESCSQ